MSRYVVATPIGNLSDLSPRASEVLRQVDTVLAEDTRVTGRLLKHIGSTAPLAAIHDHNEREHSERIVNAVTRESRAMALVSDAGTPLISDPGYHLVNSMAVAGVPVFTVPGPSAVTAALSIAGLPTDRFVFEGFLPARQAARRARIQALSSETRTLVFYEAPHRLLATIADLAELLGPRPAAVTRELTKQFETCYRAPLDQLLLTLQADENAERGEMVIVVGGCVDSQSDLQLVESLLRELLPRLGMKDAVDIVVAVTGEKRNAVKKLALALKHETEQ